MSKTTKPFNNTKRYIAKFINIKATVTLTDFIYADSLVLAYQKALQVVSQLNAADKANKLSVYSVENTVYALGE